MAFIPRLTAPEAGNKFYITISSGGYSRAIVGKPTYVCNVLANCVGYAFGRFHEIQGNTAMNCFDPYNAEDIFANAKKHGMSFGSIPKLGAVICWKKGKEHCDDDGVGHVAIVEQINPDGSIVTSESGWNCSNIFWTTKRTNADGHWGAASGGYVFQGFIYQPESSHPPDTSELVYLEAGTPIYSIDGTSINKVSEVIISTKYTIVEKQTIAKTVYGFLKSGVGWVILEAAPETRDLKRGDSGEDVKELQYALAQKTYLSGDGADGIFGNQTFGALLGFQYDNKLEMTGICDKSTRDKLFK